MATGETGRLKPSRSETGASLTEEEELKLAQKVKEFFDTTIPHRTLKPSRTELEAAGDWVVGEDASQAEILRFQELEADKEVLRTEGGTVNDDSYVVTDYYDDLNSVDKCLHHQTGTGFIETESGPEAFHLEDSDDYVFKTSNKSNPATNEWEPTPPTNVPVESKVHRSDP